MTITISPSGENNEGYNTYSVSGPGNDENIDQICEMFKGLLLAMGYSPSLVEERIEIDEYSMIQSMKL